MSLTGTVSLCSLDDEAARLTDWLGKGYNGAMRWFERSIEKRLDPRKISPDLKSAIVCIKPYDEMPPAEDPPPNAPKFLRHEDYHGVMMRELEAIAGQIMAGNPAGAVCKCYVDTGPVMEKAWAVRAGLGFIGKNTLFISPKYGSFTAIGVILTSASLHEAFHSQGEVYCKSTPPLSPLWERAGERGPLPLTPSHEGREDLDGERSRGDNRGKISAQSCGECTACIDSCPTKALVAPYVLDARKCVSYKFLIEKKRGGCDICQDVCPFNKMIRSW